EALQVCFGALQVCIEALQVCFEALQVYIKALQVCFGALQVYIKALQVCFAPLQACGKALQTAHNPPRPLKLSQQTNRPARNMTIKKHERVGRLILPGSATRRSVSRWTSRSRPRMPPTLLPLRSRKEGRGPGRGEIDFFHILLPLRSLGGRG